MAKKCKMSLQFTGLLKVSVINEGFIKKYSIQLAVNQEIQGAACNK
jgi:predicted RNA-binding protein with RPS1 domain